jgi:hypothetical protein
MGKLLEFGLHAGVRALDQRMGRFRRWLTEAVDRPLGIVGGLSACIVAAGLARAGYGDKGLREFLGRRLDALCTLTRRHGYDLYADPAEYTDIPKAFRGRPLVKPELTPGGAYTLPCIHDFHAFSALPAEMDSAPVRRKVNTLVRYALADEYQSLPPGYGILRAGKRRYYAMGWRMNLPGFQGGGSDARPSADFVQRVELMAHFPPARKHRWLLESIEHLDSFRTERGTWLWPREYLREKSVGYWVSGAHMGLEESRRTEQAFEIESTFRMQRIQKLLRGG